MTAAKTRAIAKAQSDVARPSLGLLITEPWRAAAEFVSHKIANRSIQAVGDGHPVVIFPGLGSNGLAVAPLREHCQRRWNPRVLRAVGARLAQPVGQWWQYQPLQ